MKISEWLYDLASNHYATIDDGEIVILPIIEDDDDEQCVLGMVLQSVPITSKRKD